MSDGSNLELREEPSGSRHYLEGEPVHCGTILEVKLAEGTWLPGRYEWSGCRADSPSFFIALSAGYTFSEPFAGRVDHVQVAFRLPWEAILRWPRRS